MTRFVRLLTIFAMLIGSISMTEAHAAMAMPGSAASMSHHGMQAAIPSGHCADMDTSQHGHKNQKGPGIDCTIACSVILSSAGEVVDRPLLTAMSQPLPLVASRSGLNPESDPPPPRIS